MCPRCTRMWRACVFMLLASLAVLNLNHGVECRGGVSRAYARKGMLRSSRGEDVQTRSVQEDEQPAQTEDVLSSSPSGKPHDELHDSDAPVDVPGATSSTERADGFVVATAPKEEVAGAKAGTLGSLREGDAVRLSGNADAAIADGTSSVGEKQEGGDSSPADKGHAGGLTEEGSSSTGSKEEGGSSLPDAGKGDTMEESRISEAKEEGKKSDAKEESRESQAKEESRESQAKEESRESESQEESRTSDAKEETRESEAKEESRASEAKEESREIEAKEEIRVSKAKEESSASEAKEESRKNEGEEESRGSEAKEESRESEANKESRGSQAKEKNMIQPSRSSTALADDGPHSRIVDEDTRGSPKPPTSAAASAEDDAQVNGPRGGGTLSKPQRRKKEAKSKDRGEVLSTKAGEPLQEDQPASTAEAAENGASSIAAGEQQGKLRRQKRERFDATADPVSDVGTRAALKDSDQQTFDAQSGAGGQEPMEGEQETSKIIKGEKKSKEEVDPKSAGHADEAVALQGDTKRAPLGNAADTAAGDVASEKVLSKKTRRGRRKAPKVPEGELVGLPKESLGYGPGESTSEEQHQPGTSEYSSEEGTPSGAERFSASQGDETESGSSSLKEPLVESKSRQEPGPDADGAGGGAHESAAASSAVGNPDSHARREEEAAGFSLKPLEKENSANSGVAEEIAVAEGRPAAGGKGATDAFGAAGPVTVMPSVGAPEQMILEQAALEDEEDYASFMAELYNAPQRLSPAMKGLKEKATKHVVPKVQELARSGHEAFLKTSDRIRSHVTPYLGPSASPIVATLLSFSLLLLPLFLIAGIFYQMRFILTLQRLLVLCNLYLCLYCFTLLAACIIISGEPMRGLLQAAEPNFFVLQILVAAGYLIYVCLQVFWLAVVSRAKGKERDVVLVAKAMLSLALSIGVGIHYYVAVFERAMLDKPPKITALVYLVYFSVFLFLTLIGRPVDRPVAAGKHG